MRGMKGMLRRRDVQIVSGTAVLALLGVAAGAVVRERTCAQVQNEAPTKGCTASRCS